MTLDDPFGWGKDQQRLNDLLGQHKAGQFKVDMRNVPQAPTNAIPINISEVHRQMQAGLAGVPGMNIGEIQQMPRQRRTGTGMETVNEWGFAVTKQYGKESISTGFYGVTDYGEHFYSPNFNRAGAGTIPSLVQAGREEPLSPAENFIQAMKLGKVDDPTTGQARSDIWSVLAGHAGIDWRVWNMPPAEQMRRSSGNFFAFSGFDRESDILDESERRGYFYQGGEHASLSTINIHPSADFGGIEKYLTGSAKRQKGYRGNALGYRAGDTPDIYSNVVESLINAPDTPSLRGNVVSAHLSMNPLLSPEGFATMTGSPMVEMGYGKTVRLSPEGASALQSGQLFADPQTRFPGGAMRAGTMGSLRDILGQDTPSGAAFMPRAIQHIEDDLYSVEGSVYAPGASFKQQGAKYFTGEAMPGMNQFVTRGQGRQTYDIAGVLPGEKDLPLFARMAFQANYTDPNDLQAAWLRHTTALQQRAASGEGQAKGILNRLNVAQGGEVTDFAGLLYPQGQGYTWSPGAGELFSAVAMQDLSERVQITRATQPRGVSRHHFEMFLQEGLQQAGVETQGMGISGMLGEWGARGLSQREFMGQQFSLFDPKNVRPVGGGSFDEAQGFLISGMESPAYTGNMMGMFRPEYEGSRTTLGGDYLEQLALYNPKLLDYIQGQDAAGAYYNPARRVTMAHLSNESEDYLSQQRIEEFDAAKWRNIRAKYAAANLSADAGLQATMRDYAQSVGDDPTAMRVRVGGNEFMFPNLNDLSRTAIMNDRDELIKSPAASMGRMLDVLSSSDPEMGRAQQEAIQSTYNEMEQYVNLPGVMKEALGITVPNLGGHIRAAPGLPGNAALMRMQDVMQQTGLNRAEVIRRTGFGGGVEPSERLTAALLLDPASNPLHHTLGANIIPVDYGDMGYLPRELQEVVGSSTRLAKNQLGISELLTEAGIRDVDADTLRAVLGSGFDVKSPDELLAIAQSSASSETLKQGEKIDSFLSGLSGSLPLTANPYGKGSQWKTKIGLNEEAISDERSRMNIGQLYNLGNRVLSSFGLGLAGMAGLNEQGMGQLRGGIGRLASGMNQGAMDLNSVFQSKGDGTPESGILNYMSFMRSINISPGSRGFGYYETAEGEERHLPGGAQMDTNLGFLMTDIIGRMGESFSDKDYAGFAPALAAGMMSISSFNRPDAPERQQQITDMLTGYRAGGYKAGGLDINRLVELSGASRIEELAFGSAADPSAASTLLGALGAASGEHAEKWREGYTEEYRASQTTMRQLRRGHALRNIASATKRGGMGIRQALSQLGEYGITTGMKPPSGGTGGPVMGPPGGSSSSGGDGPPPPIDLPPAPSSGGDDDDLRGMFSQLMGAIGEGLGGGSGGAHREPSPLSDEDTDLFLKLGAQYSNLQARYLNEGTSALEGLNASRVFKDLTQYNKLGWRLQSAKPIPGSLADQLFSNAPSDDDARQRRQVFGDMFGDNPEAGALFMGMRSTTGRPLPYMFDQFLGTGQGAVREEVGTSRIIPPADILQYATGEREIGGLQSSRTRRAQALMRNIGGGDEESSGIAETTKALADHFERLTEAMKSLGPVTEGYITQTKEQAQVLKEGSYAIQTLTGYAGELVTEYQKSRGAQPTSTHAEIISQMGQRGVDLMSLVGTAEQPGALVQQQGALDRFEDLGSAQREGRLQTESQRRSMRAMGAYYGMQAMQRVIGQTIGIQSQEAMAVAPFEQNLAAGAGVQASPLGVAASQQQNAMIARGYAAQDTFGWAGQMGNEFYSIPGIANVAQTARGAYGLWMGARLQAENMNQLMGEGFRDTRMGKITNALPAMATTVGQVAVAGEVALQGLNFLGATQGASMGGLGRELVGGIGDMMSDVGINGTAISILASQNDIKTRTLSQQMAYSYMQDATVNRYSAQTAAGITGQIASVFGPGYAVSPGRDRGQVWTQQATRMGADAQQYASTLMGIGQQWAPTNPEAAIGLMDTLAGTRIPLSTQEAYSAAQINLTNQAAAGGPNALQRVGSIIGASLVTGTAGAGAASIIPGLGTAVGFVGGLAVGGIAEYAALKHQDKGRIQGVSETNILAEAQAMQQRGETRALNPDELGRMKDLLSQYSTEFGGLSRAYGRDDGQLLLSALGAAGITTAGGFRADIGQRQQLERGLGLENAFWQQTGMTMGLNQQTFQWAGGLQQYQYGAAQQYMGMISPYVSSAADMTAQLQGTFRPSAGAQETTNLVQLAQRQQQMGYQPGVTGLGDTIKNWEPWRVSSLADFQQQAAYWTGTDVGEWGTVSEQQRNVQWSPATGASADQLRARGLTAQTWKETFTTTQRPGKMQGAADLLTGMTQAQLGGMGSTFEILMGNVGAPPKGVDEQQWMAGQTQDILKQLKEAYSGLYGRQISSLAGLGQVYQGLGMFGDQFNQQFGQASQFVRDNGWLAGQSAAGFTEFGWGMGLNQKQAVQYGMQYGQQFQQPYMAQQLQTMTQNLVGIGGEVLPSSQFLAPLLQDSTSLERSRLSGFLGGSQLEYSRMLTGQDSGSKALRERLQDYGVDLSKLTPMLNTKTGQSVWYEQQLQNQYTQMMMPYMDEKGQTLQGPGGTPMTWQFMRQQEDYQMNRAFTFGGNFNLMGQQYNIPMGQLGIQQAQFGLQGERQEYSFALQERQLGIQRQRFQENIGVTAHQQARQYEWQVQDLNYQENRSDLSFSWKMEDYDEQLRFSRGRQRRLLMRDRDREVISHTMEKGHTEDVRGRLEEQRQWQEEALDRQKKYYDQDEALSRERLQREKDFYTRDRELQRQQMEMQRLQAQLSDQIAQRDLAHNQLMMQKTYAIQQAEWQIKLQQDAANAAMHLFYTQTLPAALSNYKNTTIAVFQQVFASLQTLATNAINNVTNAIALNAAKSAVPQTPLSKPWGYSSGGLVSRVMSSEAAEFNAMIAMGARHFAEGGSTGGNTFNRPAGIVHEGEWVVPQQGSLVIRADNQVQVLREILSVLQRIEKKGGPGFVLNMKARETRQAVSAAIDLYDTSYGG